MIRVKYSTRDRLSEITRNEVGESSWRKRMLLYAMFKGDAGFTFAEHDKFYYPFAEGRKNFKGHKRDALTAGRRGAMQYLTSKGWVTVDEDGRYVITANGEIACREIARRDAKPLVDD